MVRAHAPAARAAAIGFARRHHAEQIDLLTRPADELAARRDRIAWADNDDLAAAGGHVTTWN